MSHIIAAFTYSTALEIALTKLVENGIKKEDIVAIPLNSKTEESIFFDTTYRSDGNSLLDVACVTGMIFMLLGAIYGFILAWGPIIWGLIGLVIGFFLGLLLDLLFTKHKIRKKVDNPSINVFVTVKCTDNQMELVEQLLWDYHALGIGRLGIK